MIIIPQRISQRKLILDYLRVTGSITPIDALEQLGCFRLSARIKELRDMGYDIRTVKEHRYGKHYARYYWKGRTDDLSN